VNKDYHNLETVQDRMWVARHLLRECPSVFSSVCHIHELRVSGLSKYMYILHHIAERRLQLLEAKFCNHEFREFIRTSALKRGTPYRQQKLDQYSAISRSK